LDQSEVVWVEVVSVCPEEAGGFPTPSPADDIRGCDGQAVLDVSSTVATRADDGVGVITIFCPNRHTSEVDAVQHVRVDEFRRQVEGNDIEVTSRAVCINRKEWQVVLTHLGFEIGPGRIGTFSHSVVAFVQDFVQDLQALIGEADLIGIRVCQQPADHTVGVFGLDRAVLTADITGRFFHPGEQWL
jgi:hypothetical protein